MDEKTEPMSGKSFLRALAYALKAVPSGDDHPALQHVTFHGDRVIGAGQTRRHDGYLPSPVQEPLSCTRESARLLLMALEYTHRASKERSGTFSVTMDGHLVSIHYGARSPIEHELQGADVGSHPRDLREWVPGDAPLNPDGLGHISCGDLREASSWWRSWEKDHGTCEVRGGQEGGPVRIDVTCGGERVATAFVLPQDHPPAELRDSLPLFDGVEACGRSNLDLDLSGDGSADAGAQIVKVGDVELNVTGLRVPLESLLCTGPCEHRDTHDACLPCTEDRIASVKRAQQLEDANESPGGKRRGKRRTPQNGAEAAE